MPRFAVTLAIAMVAVWAFCPAPVFVDSVLIGSVRADTAVANDSLDFNRDIRPILFGKCVTCHGPDEEERAAGLRLDTAEGAREDLGGYAAVVPGDPDESEMLLRITTDDSDMVMPPADKGSPLTETEKELIRRWISEGAEYDVHWSYRAPKRPKLPQVEHQEWAASAIDYFTLAMMEQKGLHPSPRADRFAIARRAALDLTGLPPTWEQAEAFARDTSVHAYENYVDQLLATPAFGERWARVWLDLARYADSAGYADDPPRTIWAYRDYVVDAINANLPFDQFTVEQIAGDLLENPTERQLIATAFHRNTLTNNEGGTNDEEFRNVAVVDRVNTTMAVWMGTTMACAQCHTHKYDPITHEEYFKFFAFFNSTADADRRDESPTIELWTEAAKTRKQTLVDTITQLESDYAQDSPDFESEFAAWTDTVVEPTEWTPLKPSHVESSRMIDVDDDGWMNANGDKPDKDDYELTIPVERGDLTALRLEISPKQTSNFVLSQITATWTPGEESAGTALPITFSFANADFEQKGFPAASAIGDKVDANRGWAISPKMSKEHQLELLLSTRFGDQPGTLRVTLKQQSKYAKHLLDVFRLTASRDANAASWVKLPANVRQIASTAIDRRSDEETDQLREYFRSIAPSLAPIRKQLQQARGELAKLKPITTVPVMRELPESKRRTTKIQIRGNYQTTGQTVDVGVPDVFHELETEGRPTRLDLAKWLVAPENPLTARVIVNRHWEQLFGIGLVETSEEFGSQGELPSHPMLLDWLAVDLIENGWDIKRLLKQIVMSETYRQSSMTTSEAVAIDPANRWLARGPRFRISAEMVRDQALFVSGLLVNKVSGPPAKPPQPAMGLKAAFGSATDWQTSQGEDRFRRGLYTTWRRSNPYPSMAQFDAPNREVCTVRRIRTNTPLQALVTLNDPVYVEAAQSLARRCLKASTDPRQRIEWLFEQTLIRKPTDAEISRLLDLVNPVWQRYQSDHDAAIQMATEPLGPLPEDADAAEYATWTVVGNVMLNLDELLMKR
ncbi:PSD1 and planctomycete cytochrome C domain-containing protein [Roseiconus lacunae]|uniref:PSD1 and planctomycete cytochrome C domain-containing protein n=1 Tax=Roseiconus lacunae TaxID=2605694 RepID=UPI0030854944|nr:PSD1 and planctomycete cytochrome C domain-containing protein [Stieleria sp. HD01]